MLKANYVRVKKEKNIDIRDGNKWDEIIECKGNYGGNFEFFNSGVNNWQC